MNVISNLLNNNINQGAFSMALNVPLDTMIGLVFYEAKGKGAFPLFGCGLAFSSFNRLNKS
ncbi:hypothetical protein N9Y89_01510 [bacterium]|nr:hypothetical protein [bacterium]